MFDENNCLYRNLNKDMVLMEKVENKADKEQLKEMLTKHLAYTGSKKAQLILEHFNEYLPKFKKIIPEDFKKMMQLTAAYEEQGMDYEKAQIEAFYESIQ